MPEVSPVGWDLAPKRKKGKIDAFSLSLVSSSFIEDYPQELDQTQYSDSLAQYFFPAIKFTPSSLPRAWQHCFKNHIFKTFFDHFWTFSFFFHQRSGQITTELLYRIQRVEGYQMIHIPDVFGRQKT